MDDSKEAVSADTTEMTYTGPHRGCGSMHEQAYVRWGPSAEKGKFFYP